MESLESRETEPAPFFLMSLGLLYLWVAPGQDQVKSENVSCSVVSDSL